MHDHLVRAITKDGFVNAVAITSREIVERARQIHKTLPTATAALGRLLTAASMMGNMQKVDDGLKDVEITDDDTLYGQIKGLGERVANVTGLDELADDFGDLWDRIVGRSAIRRADCASRRGDAAGTRKPKKAKRRRVTSAFCGLWALFPLQGFVHNAH